MIAIEVAIMEYVSSDSFRSSSFWSLQLLPCIAVVLLLFFQPLVLYSCVQESWVVSFSEMGSLFSVRSDSGTSILSAYGF